MKIVLIGGFLGSGKSTAVRQACSYLFGIGKPAAVVTNDQGVQLVDSAYMEAERIPVCEVTNGCFCCNYPDLDAGIDELSARYNPHIIFAESVGSCTDLIATVVNPLLQFRPGAEISVSIFVDAVLFLRMLNGEETTFDNTVQYIYDKQLEEADILVLSKADLLSQQEKQLIAKALNNTFPEKKWLFQDSYETASIQTWLQAVEEFVPKTTRKSLEIDYSTYGKGEAMLAWLDQSLVLTAADAPIRALELIELICNSIKAFNLPVGHVKFIVNDGEQQHKISFTQSGFTDGAKEVLAETESPSVSMLINARVQTHPDHLKQLVAQAILNVASNAEVSIQVKEPASFQPGYPTPTHRMVS